MTNLPGMRKYRGVCEDCDVEMPWRVEYAHAANDRSRHLCPAAGGELSAEAIMHMARKAARLAARKMSFFADVEDMEGDAMVAGIKAARTWKPEAGMQLGSYVWMRMNGDIIDGIRRRGRLSRNDSEKVKAARKAGEDDRLLGPAARIPANLDQLLEIGYDHEDQVAQRPFDLIAVTDQARWLLSLLSERRRPGAKAPSEREVVERCVMGGEPLLRVAVEYGVTESRICQIKTAALNRLYDLLMEQESRAA